MEGIASEAASLAGHWGLSRLVYLYDQNDVTIDGRASLAFSERVPGRFAAYGWHVQEVDGHDPAAVAAAIAAARAESGKPSLVCCKTVIGHGAPNLAGSHKTHGAPLGAAEVAATKKAMGWPEEPFYVPDAVRTGLADLAEGLAKAREAWEGRMAEYGRAFPGPAEQLSRLWAGRLPDGVLDAIPRFAAGEKLATRKAGAKILAGLADAHPTLVGGSADLTESNGVDISRAGVQSRENPGGRAIHFGVREHGMAGICNGLALHGGVRPFCGTFLVFSDFMRGALRLCALMGLPVTYVFSHESFFLGEDGPTHQPIEHLAALRAMPNLHVFRPADAKETALAWRHALSRTDGPTAILVTRQDLPILEETGEGALRGGYVLWQPDGVAAADLEGILIATGSEVSLALAAARALAERGQAVRVVSLPCWEVFSAQAVAYRDEVLPPTIGRRLAVEAGSSFGWERFAPTCHGIDRFGASAPAADLARFFGFTVDALLERWGRS
jgi:transketolase